MWGAVTQKTRDSYDWMKKKTTPRLFPQKPDDSPAKREKRIEALKKELAAAQKEKAENESIVERLEENKKHPLSFVPKQVDELREDLKKKGLSDDEIDLLVGIGLQYDSEREAFFKEQLIKESDKKIKAIEDLLSFERKNSIKLKEEIDRLESGLRDDIQALQKKEKELEKIQYLYNSLTQSIPQKNLALNEDLILLGKYEDLLNERSDEVDILNDLVNQKKNDLESMKNRLKVLMPNESFQDNLVPVKQAVIPQKGYRERGLDFLTKMFPIKKSYGSQERKSEFENQLEGLRKNLVLLDKKKKQSESIEKKSKTVADKIAGFIKMSEQDRVQRRIKKIDQQIIKQEQGLAQDARKLQGDTDVNQLSALRMNIVEQVSNYIDNEDRQNMRKAYIALDQTERELFRVSNDLYRAAQNQESLKQGLEKQENRALIAKGLNNDFGFNEESSKKFLEQKENIYNFLQFASKNPDKAVAIKGILAGSKEVGSLSQDDQQMIVSFKKVIRELRKEKKQREKVSRKWKDERKKDDNGQEMISAILDKNDQQIKALDEVIQALQQGAYFDNSDDRQDVARKVMQLSEVSLSVKQAAGQVKIKEDARLRKSKDVVQENQKIYYELLGKRNQLKERDDNQFNHLVQKTLNKLEKEALNADPKDFARKYEEFLMMKRMFEQNKKIEGLVRDAWSRGESFFKARETFKTDLQKAYEQHAVAVTSQNEKHPYAKKMFQEAELRLRSLLDKAQQYDVDVSYIGKVSTQERPDVVRKELEEIENEINREGFINKDVKEKAALLARRFDLLKEIENIKQHDEMRGKLFANIEERMN